VNGHVKRATVLAIALACSVGCAVGCSSSTGATDTAGDEHCDPSNRNGIYAEHFVERSGGTCGPLPDVQVQLASDLPALTGCTFDAPDDVSADQCTVSRAFTCPAGNGVSDPYSVVSVTIDARRDGSVFQETLQLVEYDDQGAVLCASTYDVTDTRR